jgi:hypothetical protein
MSTLILRGTLGDMGDGGGASPSTTSGQALEHRDVVGAVIPG